MPKRAAPPTEAKEGSAQEEPALKVLTLYQDPLTRHWAEELWGRVGELVGPGGVKHESRKISELTDPVVFAHSVRAATEADVLVISVRDAGELPMTLHVWVEAWMPNRGRHDGALVALIGVPSQPHAQSGRAHAYLESVAQRAGMDFLPRERKLPRKSPPLVRLAGISPVTGLPMPWSVTRPNWGTRLSLGWGVVE